MKKNEPTVSWKVDKKFDVLEIEEIKFLFSLAEKQLEEILKSNEAVVARATTLFSLVSGLIILFAGYIVGKWVSFSEALYNKNLLTAIGGLLYLTILMIFIANNIKGTKQYQIGHSPKEILIEHFIDPYFEKEKGIREKEFYFAELEIYQTKIDENIIVNIKKWRLQNNSLLCIVFFPFALLAIAFILYLF